jgi:hypothetical protein
MAGNGSRAPSPPIPREPITLALRRESAAHALGVSEETFDAHVRPSLPVVRMGTVRVYPVAALERWLAEHAEAPADELERLA